MNSYQDYQYLISQTQTLKKQYNAQKLAHQSTIQQLSVSYQLNKQLQQVIKSQTVTINSLHKQLSDKSNQLSQIAQNYQIQLIQLKQFVHVKERELEGFRGEIVGMDYNAIRLRVVSQLQLAHKDQIQEINKQVIRLEKMLSNEKLAKQTALQKYQHIKKQMEKQDNKHQQQLQQRENKHIKQTNKIYDKYQNQRILKKQAQKQLQNTNKKYHLLQQKYQSDINKAYANNTHSHQIPNNKYQTIFQPSKNKLQNLQQKIHEKDLEINSLKKKIEQLNKKLQQTTKQFQQKIKENKQNSIQYQQHIKILKQKQRQNEDIVQGYQKKLKNCKQDYYEQIRKINRQNQNKLQQLRNKLQKQNISRNVTNINNSPYSPRFGQESKHESLEKQKLQKRISNLQKQNEQLAKQLKQKQKGKKIDRSFERNNIEVYKDKLKQANQQIVNLLLQKANLVKQINKYKK